MAKRGRKSASALAVVATGPIERIARAKAPAELTTEQAAEWRAVVDRMPADWFPRETHSTLAQFCRHVVAARHIAQLVEAEENRVAIDPETGEPVGINLIKYDMLLKMQEREGRAICALARGMWITQQATIRAEQARKPSQAKKPWDPES